MNTSFEGSQTIEDVFLGPANPISLLLQHSLHDHAARPTLGAESQNIEKAAINFALMIGGVTRCSPDKASPSTRERAVTGGRIQSGASLDQLLGVFERGESDLSSDFWRRVPSRGLGLAIIDRQLDGRIRILFVAATPEYDHILLIEISSGKIRAELEEA